MSSPPIFPPPPSPFAKRRILIVVYNLTGVSSAYSQLYDALSRQGQWWHYIPNLWLIDTVYTPEQVSAALKPHLLAADRVFVGTLQDGFAGFLPQDAWDWLYNHGLRLK